MLPGALRAQRPGRVGKGHAELVAATVRTSFAQITRVEARKHLDVVAKQFPGVAALLHDTRSDLTAFADFHHAHWQEIWSTNLLERLSHEVKRRTDVVGIIPNPTRCCACPPACSLRRTTSDKAATAAT